ncbi:DUF4382 domain-containing protein [Hymenobacter chitinivorans]|uniref:Uncharacterized protein DUF4382 n=1 Tax=Hymenobacter chitinivorans DSM 11115 TaxID=1121954 RepID=A0A2M9B4E8_9BACT|nr:DUF4382 domain-containing protein [Hymenobacter chitinivorans]PJJ52814.1 uncharacterized protein DUF4382 [Hymenobacter chitinivorans DSM 11115]
MKTNLLLSGLLSAGVLLTGCEDALKDVAVSAQSSTQDAKKTPVAITYFAVNIDLQRVDVSQDADENTSNWATLRDVAAGKRDLLKSGTAASPLFVTAGFQAGTVKQLRLVLGSASTITLNNGRTVALDTPSGEQSGLKVKVNRPVNGGSSYAVLVTIDPNWQVVARGNGTYGLKPVLEGNVIQTLGGNGDEGEARTHREVTSHQIQ